LNPLIWVGSLFALDSTIDHFHLSDRALFGGFAIGDAYTAAFVRRFQGLVYGLAIKLLNDRGLAEEVAQEAFVRTRKHAATYDPERTTVGTWLLRITRNLAIDALGHRRPVALDPEMVPAHPPGPAVTVEDATVIPDLTARTGAALIRLPSGPSQGRLAGRLLRPHRPTGRRVRGLPSRGERRSTYGPL
jgi:RNA polymerase sigma factor (sigma-70 family)